ncbi:hypothetical protein F0562_035434 [Nyssa sinensis]|uniref:Auxin-responsive protein n=1 Tax=Nyssa sinensis TaxID=561372 RepID=A0A5J5AE33_9ASTE|nr:hypothetical protein F0562_035434 [Nyssa sinensis]
MESTVAYEGDLNLKATELRLGLPGTDESEKQTTSIVRNNKRASPDTVEDCGSSGSSDNKHSDRETAPAAKAQVVGWPPIRSYRKNSFQPKQTELESGIYVKISMDGAPYLRKIDLKLYKGYPELLKALENMFKLTIGKNTDLVVLIYMVCDDCEGDSNDECVLGFTFPGEYSEREGYKGSEYAPTYEDKDGDWMLAGDVPWE